MAPRFEFRARFTLLLAAAVLAFPAVSLAAEKGGKWGLWLTIGRFFNLALVIGVLVWVARKPLAKFYVNRTAMIREQLDEAQKARAEAEAKLAEIESRMSRLDQELNEIKATAEQEAQAEYRRLVEVAEQDAQKVTERARQEIEGLTRAAQLELRTRAAELAVQLAEERIRQEISPEDRRRLFSQFVTRLGGAK